MPIHNYDHFDDWWSDMMRVCSSLDLDDTTPLARGSDAIDLSHSNWGSTGNVFSVTLAWANGDPADTYALDTTGWQDDVTVLLGFGHKSRRPMYYCPANFGTGLSPQNWTSFISNIRQAVLAFTWPSMTWDVFDTIPVSLNTGGSGHLMTVGGNVLFRWGFQQAQWVAGPPPCPQYHHFAMVFDAVGVWGTTYQPGVNNNVVEFTDALPTLMGMGADDEAEEFDKLQALVSGLHVYVERDQKISRGRQWAYQRTYPKNVPLPPTNGTMSTEIDRLAGLLLMLANTTEIIRISEFEVDFRSGVVRKCRIP